MHRPVPVQKMIRDRYGLGVYRPVPESEMRTVQTIIMMDVQVYLTRKEEEFRIKSTVGVGTSHFGD